MEKKYTLIVMLPKGDKTLVRNSDNCVVQHFHPIQHALSAKSGTSI